MFEISDEFQFTIEDKLVQYDVDDIVPVVEAILHTLKKVIFNLKDPEPALNFTLDAMRDLRSELEGFNESKAEMIAALTRLQGVRQ